MIKTSFANPHGLVNPLNVSTAKDIMTLSKYSMENK
jgi:D-alanyl-D-alanine carboxypeptidase